MKRLEIISAVVLVITSTISCGEVENELILFPQRQPYFEKSTYRANVIESSVEIIDGPIRLLNCDVYNFGIEIFADETKYYPIVNPPSPSELIKNCSVLFFAYTRECQSAEDVLYDIITLEAVVDDSQQVARTNIVIINTSSLDPYKLVYNVNGTEYVILNYFYFKLFLLVIVVTGALILILEIREIVHKYKSNAYLHLEDEVNYI